MQKKFLSPQEQIEHLKRKGVTFNYISEEKAKEYLRKNNNYYKLCAYRKNFKKDEEGKYVDLDFAYLQDLAIIDMLFRYQIMTLCLDVEHFEKVKLLDVLNIKGSDGYDVIKEYYNYLDCRSTADVDELSKLKKELRQNEGSIYCKDIMDHNGNLEEYKGLRVLPVWVFVEIVPFGRFRDFFEFCARKYGERKLKEEAYILKRVKSIRNAAGHSNCIINDLNLRERSRYPMENRVIKDMLKFGIIKPMRINGIDDEPKQLQNDRIKEIITLLYAHKELIPSRGMLRHYTKSLDELIRGRMVHHAEYYKENEVINNFFDIIDKTFSAWYIDKCE